MWSLCGDITTEFALNTISWTMSLLELVEKYSNYLCFRWLLIIILCSTWDHDSFKEFCFCFLSCSGHCYLPVSWNFWATVAPLYILTLNLLYHQEVAVGIFTTSRSDCGPLPALCWHHSLCYQCIYVVLSFSEGLSDSNQITKLHSYCEAKALSETVAALRSPSALSTPTYPTGHHVGCTARTWSNLLTQTGRCVVYFAPGAGCMTVSIGTTPGAAAAAAGGDR